MSHSLTLSKVVTADPGQTGTDPMLCTLTVTSTTGFTDQGVFLFQDADGIKVFQGVCGVYQYQTVPTGGALELGTRFTRANQVTFTEKSSTDLDQTLALIQQDLTALCQGLDRLTTAGSPATISIP